MILLNLIVMYFQIPSLGALADPLLLPVIIVRYSVLLFILFCSLLSDQVSLFTRLMPHSDTCGETRDALSTFISSCFVLQRRRCYSELFTRCVFVGK